MLDKLVLFLCTWSQSVTRERLRYTVWIVLFSLLLLTTFGIMQFYWQERDLNKRLLVLYEQKKQVEEMAAHNKHLLQAESELKQYVETNALGKSLSAWVEQTLNTLTIPLPEGGLASGFKTVAIVDGQSQEQLSFILKSISTQQLADFLKQIRISKVILLENIEIANQVDHLQVNMLLTVRKVGK